MPKRDRTDRDLAYTDDIIEECDFIEEATKNKNFVNFAQDPVLQRAVIMALVRIGEAAKNLSTTEQKKHTQIPWNDIAKFKDFAVHHYWKIEEMEIWKIVKDDIPVLAAAL
jgi:uncharacterized protein with HEPN domain